MGCSTFSNFTVMPEIALAKVREDAPFDKICYIGCGVTTGIGAAIWTAGVEPGASVAVFGLGGIGLNVIQGARLAGAVQIVGVDVNPAKRAMAERFGMTDFINPERGRPRQGRPGGDRGDQGRRRLYVRLHRQHRCHAPGAGERVTRLGGERRHRRRRGRARRSRPGRSS